MAVDHFRDHLCNQMPGESADTTPRCANIHRGSLCCSTSFECTGPAIAFDHFPCFPARQLATGTACFCTVSSGSLQERIQGVDVTLVSQQVRRRARVRFVDELVLALGVHQARLMQAVGTARKL